jgi:hypothetical protein
VRRHLEVAPHACRELSLPISKEKQGQTLSMMRTRLVLPMGKEGNPLGGGSLRERGVAKLCCALQSNPAVADSDFNIVTRRCWGWRSSYSTAQFMLTFAYTPCLISTMQYYILE